MRHHPALLLTFCTLLLSPWHPAWADTPAPVSTQPVSELLIQMYPEAQGTCLSLNDASLSAEVAGAIRTVSVQTGDRVNAGDLLVELDGWEYQAQLEQSKAALEEVAARREQAQRQQERTQELHKQGQATAEQLEQRSTELKALEFQMARFKAEQKMAQQRLERCRVRAPFAGVVTERQAQVGAWASPGEPLLRLVDTHNVELSAQVDAAEAVHITKGRDWFFTDASGRYPITLRTLLPVQDTKSRTREARFTFAKEKPSPGAPGRLSWKSAISYLPPHLMIHRKGELGIFLAQEGVAHFLPLPGAMEGRPAPMAGRIEGDVIVTGREVIQDGEPVRVVPFRR